MHLHALWTPHCCCWQARASQMPLTAALVPALKFSHLFTRCLERMAHAHTVSAMGIQTEGGREGSVSATTVLANINPALKLILIKMRNATTPFAQIVLIFNPQGNPP